MSNETTVSMPLDEFERMRSRANKLEAVLHGTRNFFAWLDKQANENHGPKVSWPEMVKAYNETNPTYPYII